MASTTAAATAATTPAGATAAAAAAKTTTWTTWTPGTSFLYRLFLDALVLATLLAFAHNFPTFWRRPHLDDFARDGRVDAASGSGVGFFCGDRALSFPYVADASRAEAAARRLALQLPLLVVVALEALRVRRAAPRWAWLLQLYPPLAALLLGFAAQRLFVVFSRHFLPRPRPHFLALCRPRLPDGGRCSGEAFVSAFVCQGANESEAFAELLGSFPSGAAAGAWFGCVFAVVQLQRRLRWRRSRLARPVLQLAALVAAWCVSLAGLWQHRHHASDVAVGAALGTAAALAAAACVRPVDGVVDVDVGTRQPRGSAEDVELGQWAWR